MLDCRIYNIIKIAFYYIKSYWDKWRNLGEFFVQLLLTEMFAKSLSQCGPDLTIVQGTRKRSDVHPPMRPSVHPPIRPSICSRPLSAFPQSSEPPFNRPFNPLKRSPYPGLPSAVIHSHSAVVHRPQPNSGENASNKGKERTMNAPREKSSRARLYSYIVCYRF